MFIKNSFIFQESLKDMVPVDYPPNVEFSIILDDQGNVKTGWC